MYDTWMVIKVVYDGINTRVLILTQVCKSQCMLHCSVLTIGWNIVQCSCHYYVQVTVPCIGGRAGWGGGDIAPTIALSHDSDTASLLYQILYTHNLTPLQLDIA